MALFTAYYTVPEPSGTLTAAQYNATISDLIDKYDPQYIVAHGTSQAAMQQQVDPGEVGSESTATSLEDELKRIRFAIKDVKAQIDSSILYWYETPTFGDISNDLTITNTVDEDTLTVHADNAGFSNTILTLTTDEETASTYHYIKCVEDEDSSGDTVWALRGDGVITVQCAIELTNTGADADFIKTHNASEGAVSNGAKWLATFEDTSGNVVSGARLGIEKEATWTDTASTQDAAFKIDLAVDGVLTERLTLSSVGDMVIGGGLTCTDGPLSVTSTTDEALAVLYSNVDLTNTLLELRTSEENDGSGKFLVMTSDYGGTPATELSIDLDGNIAAGSLKVDEDAAATPEINTLYKSNVIKAYGRLNAGLNSVERSYNIDSVSTGPGSSQYTITFKTAMSGSDYMVIASCERFYSATYVTVDISNRTTAGFDVFTGSNGGTDSNIDVNFIVLEP